MSIFTAGVQYNDFKGTVAADRADDVTFHDYLVTEGLASEAERIVGYRITFNENRGAEVATPGIVVYLQEGSFDEPGRKIRAVEVSMTTAKLFSFFKRFDLVMTLKGLAVDDVEVEGPHYD